MASQLSSRHIDVGDSLYQVFRTDHSPHIGAALLDVIKITAISVIDHLAEALQGRISRDIVVI